MCETEDHDRGRCYVAQLEYEVMHLRVVVCDELTKREPDEDGKGETEDENGERLNDL